MEQDEEQPVHGSVNKLDKLEEEIEELCRNAEHQEIFEEELQNYFLHLSRDQLKSVLSRMMKAMKLQVKTDDQGKTSIRLRDAATIAKLRGLDEDEINVFQAIESAGNNGLASKNIRFRTKVSTTKLTKVLTSLESRHLIKAVRLQRGQQHVKTYILFNLNPNMGAMGGQSVFGSGAAFDTVLFDMVSKLCAVTLKSRMKDSLSGNKAFNASEATAEEVLAAIMETGAVKAELSETSVEMVLKMLELNGKVERRHYNHEDGPLVKYRLHVIRNDKPDATIPCIGCPVKQMCAMDSPINPYDCPHFDVWWKKIDF